MKLDLPERKDELNRKMALLQNELLPSNNTIRFLYQQLVSYQLI